MTITSGEITLLAKDNVAVDENAGRKILSLMEALDENEDVQNVHTNVDLPDSITKS